MRPCPPGTRASGSWAARRRSPASPRALTTPPTAGRGRCCVDGHGGRRRHPRFLDEAIGPDAGAARADDGPARDGLAGDGGRAVRPHRPGHRPGAARAARRRPSPDLLGPATSEVVRLLPDLGARLEPIGALTTDGGPTAPERRQARTLEGILGLLGRLGERQPGRARHRGPPPGRRRDPGAGHVPGPDLARPARWRSSARTSPTSSRATTRGLADLAAILTGPRPPTRLDAPAARSRRAGRADRGHRGRTGVGQPAAPRGRTIGWPAARRRGAAGRPARAAERVADRLVRRPGHRPDGDPLESSAGACCACCRSPSGPSSAEQLAAVAAAFERRHGPVRAALRDRAARRRRRARRGPLGRARARRSRTASSSRHEERHRLPPRARSGGPSPATSCRSPGPATTRRWR